MTIWEEGSCCLRRERSIPHEMPREVRSRASSGVRSNIPTVGCAGFAPCHSQCSRCRRQGSDYPAAGAVYSCTAGGGWLLRVENVQSRKQSALSARALVNASGPWVSDVQSKVLGKNVSARVRLVKGSHIVVDRLFNHDRSYIFQMTTIGSALQFPMKRISR